MPILSMTGYGQGRVEGELGRFEVSLKSVNNRFCDVNVRMPREFAALEIALRNRLKDRLRRGKVDCYIQWTPPEDQPKRVTLDRALINAYREQVLALQREWGMDDQLPWRELLTMPGAVSIDPPELDGDELQQAVFAAVDAALEPMLENRRREGEALAAALKTELEKINAATEHIEAHREQVFDYYRQRLEKRLEELRARSPEAVDDNRLEAELLIFADKCDITEELVRLRAHLEAFQQALDQPENDEAGKGLEFLTQELLRETNTIGSKARQTEVNATVVEMKKALERIREQLANIV